MKYFFYKSTDGKNIYVRQHLLEGKNLQCLKGIILIAHGLGEIADYYDEFSNLANAAGFTVFINEARGHGRTAGDIGADGINKMKEDLFQLTRKIKKEYEDLPIFLLGHSMGSVIARLYAFEHGNEITGMILTGSPLHSFDLDYLLSLVEKEINGNGPNIPSEITLNAMFKDVNKQFEPVHTELDWISSDKEIIQETLKSPYSFVLFSNQFYRDFLLALKEIESYNKMSKVPKNISIYLVGGEKDIVTCNGKSLIDQHDIYKRIGINDVKFKIYKDKRHSILREINRKEVATDILSWIEEHVHIL
jgi:alpha-beta hydrolase superfamily lysophospholipase